MTGFPQKFGKFELLGRISNGGMAEVYLARAAGAGPGAKVFAIKKILPGLSADKSFQKLFEREIGMAMVLSHQNVVRILDFGAESGEYFLAMEYVHGRNLQVVGAENGRLNAAPDWAFSSFAVSQVARALAYAHGYCDPITRKHSGIIHRDVSPHNVLIGFSGQVKLFDFGVAKVGAREGTTESGAVKGKPAYLSPEQVRGEELDDRSDIFSLGIVLWEQLTGARLFFDPQPLLAIKKVVEMEIPLPSSVNPLLPSSLDGIAMKALCRDRMQRYQLAKDLAADLDRALFNEGVVFGEKQARELMARLFPASDDETACAAAPASAEQVVAAVTAPPAQPPRPRERTRPIEVSPQGSESTSRPWLGLPAFALGAALLMFGWAGAKLTSGNVSPPAPSSLVAVPPATERSPAAQRRASPLQRTKIEPVVLSHPLEDLDVQVVSLVRGGAAVPGSPPPQVTVRVTEGRRRTALVLASHEAVHWQIQLDPGARLERVIVSERGDMITATQVSIRRGPSGLQPEYVVFGYLPLSGENRRQALTGAAGGDVSALIVGNPQDAVQSLQSDICFQDAIEANQFVTGRCDKVKY